MVVFLVAFAHSALAKSNRESLEELSQQVNELSKRVLDLDQKIKEFTQKIGHHEELNRQFKADHQVALEDLRTDLKTIHGEMDLLIKQSEMQQENIQKALQDFDMRLTSFETKSTSNLNGEPQSTTDAQAQYDHAHQLLTKQKKPLEAIDAFDDFIEKNPKHYLKPNAIYWKGQAYFNQKEYTKAIQTFDLVVKQHPESTKVCDSLLKQGMGFQALKKLSQAKLFFEEVLAQCKETKTIKQARKQLNELAN